MLFPKYHWRNRLNNCRRHKKKPVAMILWAEQGTGRGAVSTHIDLYWAGARGGGGWHWLDRELSKASVLQTVERARQISVSSILKDEQCADSVLSHIYLKSVWEFPKAFLVKEGSCILTKLPASCCKTTMITRDFLTNKTQRVCINGALSNRVCSSAGVLSPLLFILYTNVC